MTTLSGSGETSRLAIGLTGGIGSGKSTVSALFAELGVPVIDTDIIAHSLTAINGAAMAPIASSFGPSFVQDSGALDRKRMRECIYDDPDAKARLEAIVHPLIRAEAVRMAAAIETESDYLLYVIPLLLEMGRWHTTISSILVVDCTKETQIERVIARSAMTRAEVLKIMSTQATRAERLAAADDVVLNDGAASQLASQVARLHEKYCSIARKKR